MKLQKKKDEEQTRMKELNDLFKIAVVQPKVPVGMLFYLIMFNDSCLMINLNLCIKILVANLNKIT